MKKNIFGILGCVLAIIMSCSIGITSFNNIKSYAAEMEADGDDEHFIGYSGNMEEEKLHDLTRLPHAVDDSPSITILVHGQSGDSSHFSNDGSGKFVYEPDSMGDILSKSLAYSVNLYLAEFDASTVEKNDFFLYDLNENHNNPYADGEESFSYSSKKIKRIENISQHSIIYFEAEDPIAVHKEVYENLHTLIDEISYDYLFLTGKIPKVNLISHSRGGLTSMMYATGYKSKSKTDLIDYNMRYDSELRMNVVDSEKDQPEVYTPEAIIHDHPFNVAGLYSMGTPYWGTDWETKFFGVAKELLPKEFATPSAHNILDSTIQEEMYQCWEQAIKVNPRLQLHAIAGEMKVSFLPGLIAEDYNTLVEFSELGSATFEQISKYVQLLAKNNEEISDFITAIELGITGVAVGTTVACPVAGFILTILVAAPLTVTLETGRSLINNISNKVEMINATLNDESATSVLTEESLFALLADVLMDVTELCEIVEEILAYVEDDPDYNIIGSWGDLFIDRDSQLAKKYNNVSRYSKVFEYKNLEFIADNGQYSVSNNTSKNFDYKKSVDSVGIPHNLETHDREIITYILHNITMTVPQSIYKYTENVDGTINVIGYDIPSYYGFETWNTVKLDLTRGINGKSISKIANSAFVGFECLESITLPNELKIIEDNAFADCINLKDVVIPSSVTYIGGLAFEDCGLNGTIELPSSLEYLGAQAFKNCKGIEAFDIANSSKFIAEDGVLFDNTKKRLLCYPMGRTDTMYTVPLSVIEIEAFAFSGNENLSIIHLNNVEVVGMFSFENCTNLNNINADDLILVEIGAFDNTAWKFNQSEDFIELGQVLIAYQGTESELVLDKYISIAPYAFADNQTLVSIILSGDLKNVSVGAFDGCSSLERVYICKTDESVYISTGAFDNNAVDRVIYVPYLLKEAYLTNELWQQYAEDIAVWETEIVYNTNGGSVCENNKVFYQDYLKLPTPEKLGYDFTGWYSNIACTGENYNEQTLWNSLEETVIFYAGWSPISYSITYVTDYSASGNVLESYVGCYTIEDGVTYDIPKKDGYTFTGWFMDYNLTQSAGTGLETGNIGNRTLYAKWDARSYTITYDLNDGDKTFPASINTTTDTVTFGSSDYQLAIPTRTGFTFNGWKVLVNGLYEFYTNEAGQSNQEWDIADDVMAVADWTRHTYYIKINADGTITWLGEDGFSSTQTSIEYGSVFENATTLEANFNSEKKSLKEGHKFDYFELSNGIKFVQWVQIASMYENGATVELTAQFEREVSFSIHYLNDEFVPEMADYGDAIELERQANLTGYTFSHWVVASVSEASENARFIGTPFAPGTRFSYVTMPDLSYDMEEDAVTIWLKAVQQPNEYQVALKTAFGTVSPSTIMVTYESGFELPIPTEVAGREFLGWCLSSENRGAIAILGTQITDENGQSISVWQYAENITLDAAWHTVAYSISYDLNGGSYPDGITNPNWYMVDDTVTLNNPIRSGYQFKGWMDDDTGVVSLATMIPKGTTGNKTFTAQWAKLYTISFNANGGSSCSSISAVLNASITLPISTKGGYKGTWNGYAFGSSYTVTGTKTFTAVWTEKTLNECYTSGVYEIWTTNQFKSIRNVATNTSNTYKLMANINLGCSSSSPWTPISQFNGTLEGNNKKISGLIVRADGVSGYFGLFGINYGDIFDVTINGSVAIGGSTVSGVYAGIICGENHGWIYNCVTEWKDLEAEVTYDESNSIYICSNYAVYCAHDDSKVGGIAGSNYGDIDYCTNYAAVFGRGDVGGIAGVNYDSGWVYKSKNYGQVAYLWATENRSIGGIVGYLCSGKVTYSSNYGLVKIYNNPTDSHTLAPKMGQVVGHSDVDGTTSNNGCYGSVNIGNLKTVTWKGGFLNLVSYSHNQAQYAGNREIGLNETE